ncbi:hypothetical protein D3C80_1629830 [compost metagenome]
MLLAFEGQDVEDGVEPADGEFMASVVKENALLGAHGQASLTTLGIASCVSMNCSVMP